MFKGFLNIKEDFEHFSVDPNRPWLKLYPNDNPKSISWDPISLPDILKITRELYPTHCAIYYVPEERKYTYLEMFIEANKITNALYEKLGVSKKESIGLMTGNIPEFAFATIGILQTGASLTPINPLLNVGDVVHIIKDAGIIKTVFVHSKNYRIIKKASKEVEIENIILLGTKESKGEGIPLSTFLEDVEPTEPKKVEIDPLNDLATLLYTGGTTGLPKGVMLTHDNIISDVLYTIYLQKQAYEENIGREITLCVLPLCHTFGFTVLITSLLLGLMMIMEGDFYPDVIMRHIRDYKIRSFVGVPLMFQLIVNHPDFGKIDLSSLEGAISGSTTLPAEVAKKFKSVVGDIQFSQGYGLTEASPITHMQPNWLPEVKPDSIGIPLLDTDAKIVNIETLEEVKPGEVGELLVKGRQVMKGYWKNPEATKRVITEDGWLRTGDLAKMIEDGWFYIMGRTKEMIKYKGYKVMPKEIENKLEEHPAISSAAVVGIEDPNTGENIKAFVSLNEGYVGKITEQEIIEWAKENLAAYKYPRFVKIVPILPRTAVGKIDKKTLQKR
ncbi:MAG: AMP-binding protein [Promethearchaeota archaeon]